MFNVNGSKLQAVVGYYWSLVICINLRHCLIKGHQPLPNKIYSMTFSIKKRKSFVKNNFKKSKKSTDYFISKATLKYKNKFKLFNYFSCNITISQYKSGCH